MTATPPTDKPQIDADRRTWTPLGRAMLAGIQVRDADIEPTRGLRAIAMLLRVLGGAVLLFMAAQLVTGITDTGQVLYRELAAEALRLAIVAALLYGAGEIADLTLKSHADLRATRILMARLAYRLGPAHDPRQGDAERRDATRR